MSARWRWKRPLTCLCEDIGREAHSRQSRPGSETLNVVALRVCRANAEQLKLSRPSALWSLLVSSVCCVLRQSAARCE